MRNLVTALFLLLSINFAQAQNQPQGNPFEFMSTVFQSQPERGYKPDVVTLKQWGDRVGMPWNHGNRLWCALWLNQKLVSMGYPHSGGYTASSFFRYGTPTQAAPNTIAVNGRHVCWVVSVDGRTITCTGGNQGRDRSVSTDTFPIGMYQYRRP